LDGLGTRIGFVSTRLSGTDGVSLEVRKWVKVLTQMGHQTFFFAGESDWAEECSYVLPEAHFEHPDILKLTKDLFDDYRRKPETTQLVEKLKFHIKEHLYKFVQQFDIQVLIIENAMAIPMNVPLGLALTELIAETCIPTLAHHHDFAWERSRYIVSAADDYLRAAFPATLNSIQHVVINSHAQRQLALRTGLASIVIPNVMDFKSPPPKPDAYSKQLREDLKIPSGNYFILQPTRIVPRKRIERAIELIKRINLPATLVISHSNGDEGTEYAQYLADYIDLLGVDVIFAADMFNETRRKSPDGKRVYALSDAYQSADLITYPSTIEGFGNAFLETIYYQRPLVMSTYEIYRVDIKPKGFHVIEFGDFITENTVKRTREILLNPEHTRQICADNYKIASRYYSFNNLEKLLLAVVSQAGW